MFKNADTLKLKLFTYDEQLLVDSLIKVLVPFKLATVMLSGEKEPTISMVLPVLHKQHCSLDPCPDDINQIVKVKKIMSENLLKRDQPEPMRNILIIASILDPRTKKLDFFTEEAIFLCIEHFQHVLSEFVASLANHNPISNPNLSVSEVSELSDDDSLGGVEAPAKKAKTEASNNPVNWLDDVLIIGQSQATLSQPEIIKRNMTAI